MRLKLFILAIFTGCIATLFPQVGQAATFSLVADGLDNPRGLSFDKDGALYVAEAGSGGTGTCLPSPNGSNLCYGNSGAITKVQSDGTLKRVLTNLPSLGAEGSSSFGAQDIKFDTNTGNPYVLLGYGADPTLRDKSLPNADLGKLVSADFATNSWQSVADLANYEVANNPDRGDVGSNPTNFIIDGNKAVIADAGGNDLLSANLDGSNLKAIATLPEQIVNNPVFPPSDAAPFDPTQVPNGGSGPSQIAIQPTPTGVAKGPDGAYYVSLFTGFPFPEGGAKIYRVDPNGKTSVYADGFTQLTDLEFDRQGNLYALQFANESAWKGNLDASLIEIAPDGTRSTLASGNGLQAASSLAVSPDGALYVSSEGDRPGAGKVWRIDNTKPVPEPTSVLGVIAFGALGMRIKKSRKLKVKTFLFN